MPPDLCCPHPFPSHHKHRPLSPTEPARPVPHNIPSIFAIAALPEDHPHALRHLERRPPRRATEAVKELIRSPSLAFKLKGQLRRRGTVRSLRAEVWEGCDGDARRIGSREVEGLVGGMGGGVGSGRMEARGEGMGMGMGSGGAPRLCLRDMSPLNSSPELMRFRPYSPGPEVRARRCRSSIDLGSTQEQRPLPEFEGLELRDLKAPKFDLGGYQLDGAAASLITPVESGKQDTAQQTTDSTAGDTDDARLQPTEDGPTGDGDPTSDLRPASSNSVHLAKLHITQQLRSMSQLSDTTDFNDRLTPETWTFHRRERSNVGTTLSPADTGRSEAMRKTSHSGVDSAQVPASWGRVRKERDNSSSIYSRPTSPEDVAAREREGEGGTWPLAEAFAPPEVHEPGNDLSLPYESDVTPTATLAPPRTPQMAASAHTLSTPASRFADSLAPAERSASQKSGSSNLTKRSRFLERFTPPKKLVKKNRSFFRFLRAGSRRQQSRSVSTPVLRCTPIRSSGRFDGPADEGELLTVQYELTAPNVEPVNRSASLNNLPSFELTQESLDVPCEIERLPSFADYERNLSLMGDDRRRPSAVNLRRLSEMQDDDRRASVQMGRRPSHRHAAPRENTLMEAALERQLREKELFRASTKRSAPGSPQVSPPAFGTTVWDEQGPGQATGAERDPGDPVTAGPSTALAGKQPSDNHLAPPLTPSGALPSSSSVQKASHPGSRKPVVLETPSSASQHSPPSTKGSPLASWSRYPSHTRAERCTSAGPPDRIHTRDFASGDINPDDIQATDETEAYEPGKRSLMKSSSKRSKQSLPRSRSATFGSIVRYYSNIFSNADFHVKGRRSSIAAGGQLKDPELEILPPIMPASVYSQPMLGGARHASDLGQIEEHTDEAALRDPMHFPSGDQQKRASGVANEPFPFREQSQHSLFGNPAHDTQPQSLTAEPASALDHSSPPQDVQAGVSLLETSCAPQSGTHPNQALDGTTEPPPQLTRSSPSKAELFSTLYQTCLTRPSQDSSSNVMPPPSLHPSKARSPRHSEETLDRASKVRRFPSVTVVDDRKGHWRSVSFISVESGKSGKDFLRESSNDLLKLMEVREREEREKLLRGL